MTVRDLAAAMREREAQWRRFAEWEASQVPAGPLDETARVRQAVRWFGEAHHFARRVGSAGPGTPEHHLEDLIALVRRWDQAWRERRRQIDFARSR